MYHKLILLFVFTCLLAVGGRLFGQPLVRYFEDQDYLLEVNHWSAEDGLPAWDVRDLIHDDRGYIWLTTDIGLVRLDGVSFKVYDEAYGFDSVDMGQAARDENGRFWIGTYKSGGEVGHKIIIFDPVLERIVEEESLTKELNELLKEGGVGVYGFSDTVWVIADDQGRGRGYGGEGWMWQLMDTVVHGHLNRSPDNQVNDTCHYNGLYEEGRSENKTKAHSEVSYYYFPAGEDLFWRMENYRFTDDDSIQLIDKNGKSVLERKLGWNHDLGCIDVDDDALVRDYRHLFDENSSFFLEEIGEGKKNNAQRTRLRNYSDCINFGVDIYKNHQGVILSTYDWKPLFFVEGKVVFGNLGDIIGKHFNTKLSLRIFSDEDGAFWFSNPEGVFRLKIRKVRFDTCRPFGNVAVSCRGFASVSDSIVYVNSYSGTFKLNINTREFENIEVKNYRSGKGMLYDGDWVWIGNHYDGVTKWDPELNKDKGLLSTGWNHRTYDGMSIFELNDSTLLMGGAYGVWSVDKKDDVVTFLPWLEEGVVNYFHKNANGVWLCTNFGLILCDDELNILQRYSIGNGEAETSVFYLHEDQEGWFWLATNKGLWKWSEDERETRQYSINEGLSNSTIHAVYEDSYGRLWLPSNYGLMTFNKKSGKVYTYYESDGLANSEFNNLSHHEMSDGRLVLGGIDGITCFHPDSISIEDDFVPPIKIASVASYNRETEEATDYSRLAINEEWIDIMPGENRLQVELVSQCLSIKDLVYEWRIPSINPVWKKVSNLSLELNQLAYGTYKVEFRSYRAGNQPVQDDPGYVLKLNVIRPFYLSIWFALILATFLGSIAFLLIRRRHYVLIARNRKLQLEVDRRTKLLKEKVGVIEKQANELKKMDEVKSRFFINASHEFRTPLSLILAPVKTLIREVKDDRQINQLKRIERNALTVKSLTDKILDLARLEAGKLTVERKEVLLLPYLKQVFNEFAELADNRGITYSLDTEVSDILRVELDGEKLERIIVNLIGNAIKFTEEGGEIIVSASCTDDSLFLSVKDSGSGISKEDLLHVFERYYQGGENEAGYKGGLGVGLAMCKELVTLLGGEISAKSEGLNKGTTMEVKLPVVLVSESVAEEPGIAETAKSVPNETLRSAKSLPVILLVEDNNDLLEYLTDLLRSQNFSVLPVRNGHEAFVILQGEGPVVDLVVSDVMMPKMNGFELLDKVRRMPQHWGLPFLLLTARSEEGDVLRGLRLGVDAYIKKPFSPEVLLATTKTLIENQQKRKAAYEQAVLKKEKQRGPVKNVDNLLQAAPVEDSFDERWLAEVEKELLVRLDDTNLKVGDLARLVNMSERSFRDKLKHCTGLSPGKYILRVRLQMAYHLLEKKAFASIAEVSYAVGIKSKAYFTNSFKAQYNKLPSEIF